MKIDEKLYRNHINRVYDVEKSLERLLDVVIKKQLRDLGLNPVECDATVKEMFARVVSMMIDREVEGLLERVKQNLRNKINE